MDATRSFKTVLETLGYTNILIVEAFPPKHVIEFARGDDTEMTDEEVAEVIPYFRVKTNQGSFGIVMGTYNLIDLKDSGYTPKDLGEADAPENLLLVTMNTVTLKLLHLKRLLKK